MKSSVMIMNEQRKSLGKSPAWVIKIGSALATNEGRGLRRESFEQWAAQIAELYRQGKQVALVSSGSIAEGVVRLGWKSRPHELHKLQAAAAVGQMGLIQAYESVFQTHGLHTAQVLLTHEDLSDRQRYLNARSTIRTLLSLGIVPIINENDTVVTEEIRFGDNDTLAGLVANLVEADLLVILTDQEGLYNQDPRLNDEAQLISDARAGDEELLKLAGNGGALGRGGMRTKLSAAKLAARSGTHTIIASGYQENVLTRLATGEDLGTLLIAGEQSLAARKRWLAANLMPQGQLTLDQGAVRVLQSEGRSLLAVGITAVQGHFQRGELVSCCDAAGLEIARGLVNYSSEETGQLLGQPSDKIITILGYVSEPELIHRDNLVLT